MTQKPLTPTAQAMSRLDQALRGLNEPMKFITGSHRSAGISATNLSAMGDDAACIDVMKSYQAPLNEALTQIEDAVALVRDAAARLYAIQPQETATPKAEIVEPA